MILRKKFYHCKLIPSDDLSIIEYEPPKEKYGNYQPLNGYADILQYGQNISKKWRMFVPYAENINEYHENDLLYLDGAEPNVSSQCYTNGDGANARITAVLPQYLVIRIEIEKIIERW